MTILSDRQIYARCVPPSMIAIVDNWEARPFRPDINENAYYLDNTGHLIPHDSILGNILNLPPTDKNVVDFKPMIHPFSDSQVKTIRKFSSVTACLASKHAPDPEDYTKRNTFEEKIISYGLSSYGYDLRIGNKFKIFHNALSTTIDPKNFDELSFINFEGDVCIIPPNSFVLAASFERIQMPRDVTGIVLGKSTYARCGISCLATPLEAGWEGYVTLEFANTTPLPAKIYAYEGACQVIFYQGSTCAVSYADRAGKYMNQEPGPVVPRV